MVKFVKSFIADESGASAAEYALILAVVGAGIAGAAFLLGDAIREAIDEATAEIEAGGQAPAPAPTTTP